MLLLALTVVHPGGALPLHAERLDFPTHVLPLLTKAGCNSGACHGAATGQGGLRLSLLGYDPEHDHVALTRELGARRVDFGSPAQSLFLLKATDTVDHEGGRRLRPQSPEVAHLERWIGAGAPYGPSDLRVVAIDVTPPTVLAGTDPTSFQLRVQATLSDGTREDVTAQALYDTGDDAVAAVDRQGSVRVRGPGTTGVMVRFAGQVAAVRVDSPFPGDVDRSAFEAFVPENAVDALVLTRLRQLNLPPSPRTDDATFLRRVTLDLAGRLPTRHEIESFLGRPESGAKRRDVIARLLASDEFVDLWTHHFADLFLISGRRGTEAATRSWHAWLRHQVATNRPWNELVRDTLTASGPLGESGPAAFFTLATDPRDLSEQVATLFLGVQLGCARCHAHPSDRWTQKDYHQFAAYLAQVRREDGVIGDGTQGEVEDPKTGRALPPRPLGVEAPAAPPDTSRRSQLAEWITRPDNRGFARACVNRVWKHLLGRGLVEPVDDLRPTNPATHPEVLDYLADQFMADGFDLRRLIRTIAESRTYQLSSEPVPGNASDTRLLSHALIRSPKAAVLLDMISQATGVPERFPDQPDTARALQLVGTQTPSETLDVLGRCSRERLCDTASAAGGGLAQALHLINGPAINSRLPDAIANLRTDDGDVAGTIHDLYLRTLSRPPRPEETAAWKARIAGSPDRREALEDLLWALLNSREFVFIR